MPKFYQCPWVPDDLQPGAMADPAWLQASWTDDFVDIRGEGLPAPRFRSRAKMVWSSTHFWVGAFMEEPCLWATLTEHDSVIFQDHDFEVFIDPDGDALNYFEFEVNALGTTWDLFLAKPYRDGGSADNSWESNARVHVTLDGTLNDPCDVDRGWWVEIGFPWTCFAERSTCVCPPRPGDVWKVNFSRVQWQLDIVEGKILKRPGLPEDNWVWSPQGIIDMHQPEQWGEVMFVAGPVAG